MTLTNAQRLVLTDYRRMLDAMQDHEDYEGFEECLAELYGEWARTQGLDLWQAVAYVESRPAAKYDAQLATFGLRLTRDHKAEHIDLEANGDGICDFCDDLINHCEVYTGMTT